MASDAHSGRPKLLIVDDDVQLLDSLALLTSRSGFDTIAFPSASAAMDAVEDQRFDVILSDIAMPGLDGLEFMRIVRSIDLDVPIVLMTGVPSKDSAIKAVEYGAYRYLEKPVDPPELDSVLRKACSMHNLTRLRREATHLSGPFTLQLGNRAALETRFDRALGGLWLSLQPILHVQSGVPIGYEAFVRSDEPTLPKANDLFDAAGRLQRIHDLGRAIRALGAQVATSLPEGRLLFINVSAAELNDNELLSESAPLVAIANRVVLELTERESLDGVAGLSTRLDRLRRHGFRIGLDGLGTGYADLAGFSRVEPEFVKLGGALIRNLHRSGRRRSLVGGMAKILAGDLGVMVIATAVEDAAESEALQALGIELMQGHLFGPALDMRGASRQS